MIDEAKTLSAIIREGYPLITWQKFQEIIVDIRNRKILQGETTLYISPKLLHIKLWADWWDWRAVSSLTEHQSWKNDNQGFSRRRFCLSRRNFKSANHQQLSASGEVAPDRA